MFLHVKTDRKNGKTREKERERLRFKLKIDKVQ